MSSGWTIFRGDGDNVDVVPCAERIGSVGGWRDQAFNGTYPSRLAALEAAEAAAVEELITARSRVRKLRARLWRERRKSDATR